MREARPLRRKDGVQAGKDSSGKAVVFWETSVPVKPVIFATNPSYEF